MKKCLNMLPLLFFFLGAAVVQSSSPKEEEADSTRFVDILLSLVKLRDIS